MSITSLRTLIRRSKPEFHRAANYFMLMVLALISAGSRRLARFRRFFKPTNRTRIEFGDGTSLIIRNPNAHLHEVATHYARSPVKLFEVQDLWGRFLGFTIKANRPTQQNILAELDMTEPEFVGQLINHTRNLIGGLQNVSEHSGQNAIDLIRRHNSASARLYGTGPSAPSMAPQRTPLSTGIACNSWVKAPKLMRQLGVKIVVAGDPVFHVGPSPYARRFRKDLTAWLRTDSENIFVSRQSHAHLYFDLLPSDIHSQLAFLDDSLPVYLGRKQLRNQLRLGRIPSFWNVLPLLMFPVASILGATQISTFGFDGGDSDDRNRFWRHSELVQYTEELAGVKEIHPEFFNRSFVFYRMMVAAQNSRAKQILLQ